MRTRWVLLLVAVAVAGFCLLGYLILRAGIFHITPPATGPILRIVPDAFDPLARVQDISFGPDGETLAAAGWTRSIGVWNVRDGSHVRSLPASSRRVAFWPPDQLCAVVEPDAGRPIWSSGKQVSIWDLRTGERVSNHPRQELTLQFLAFSPDGKALASRDVEQNLRLRDTASGALLLEFESVDGRGELVFSPDGEYLVMGSRKMPLWDVASGKLLRNLAMPNLEGLVQGVAFSPEGGRIAVSDGYAVHLLDVERAVEIRYYDSGHFMQKYGYVSVAFSPDGKALAATTVRGPVHVWDVGTGDWLFRFEGHTYGAVSVVYSPDGKILATGGWDGRIMLWDVAPGP